MAVMIVVALPDVRDTAVQTGVPSWGELEVVLPGCPGRIGDHHAHPDATRRRLARPQDRAGDTHVVRARRNAAVPLRARLDLHLRGDARRLRGLRPDRVGTRSGVVHAGQPARRADAGDRGTPASGAASGDRRTGKVATRAARKLGPSRMRSPRGAWHSAAPAERYSAEAFLL